MAADIEGCNTAAPAGGTVSALDKEVAANNKLRFIIYYALLKRIFKNKTTIRFYLREALHRVLVVDSRVTSADNIQVLAAVV